VDRAPRGRFREALKLIPGLGRGTARTGCGKDDRSAGVSPAVVRASRPHMVAREGNVFTGWGKSPRASKSKPQRLEAAMILGRQRHDWKWCPSLATVWRARARCPRDSRRGPSAPLRAGSRRYGHRRCYGSFSAHEGGISDRGRQPESALTLGPRQSLCFDPRVVTSVGLPRLQPLVYNPTC
jgi:hypothetical protein